MSKKYKFILSLIVLVFYSNIVNAQSPEIGKYRFTYSSAVWKNGGLNYSTDDCDHFYSIKMLTAGQYIYQYTSPRLYSFPALLSYITFTELASNVSTSLYVGFEGKRGYNDWGSCESKYGTNSISVLLDFDNNTSVEYVAQDLIPNYVGGFNLWVIPDNVSIQQVLTKNELFCNKNRTLYATTGFGKAIYKWMYSSDSLNWDYFPSNLQGNSSVTFNGVDLFGSNSSFLTKVGKKTHIKIEYGTGRYSNTVSLVNTLEAPILTELNSTPALCNESNDGILHVKINRSVYPGEVLYLHMDNVVVDSVKNIGNKTFHLGGLGKGEHYLQLKGIYRNAFGEYDTYTDSSSEYTAGIIIRAPDSITYSNQQITNVNCFGGNDGKLEATINGGTHPYTFYYKKDTDSLYNAKGVSYEWELGGVTMEVFNHLILKNLSKGNYQYYIQDFNRCSTFNNIQTFTISEPDTSVFILDTTYIQPLAYGYSDGSLIVEIAGGTPNYNVEWQDSNNVVLANRTVLQINGKWIDTLKNIPAGRYTLIVKDNNYTCGTGTVTNNCQSCYYTGSYTLDQPPPLVVEIIQADSVLCYGTNEASIYAVADGGVPYTNKSDGLRYDYIWYQKIGGIFQEIPNQTDTITKNLYAGIYKVEIIDYNRIHKMSDEFTVGQPDSLILNFTHVPASCSGREDGELTVHIQGGMLPYSIEWMGNADSTETITQMPAGTYAVSVTDRNACRTYDRGTITTPSPIIINDSVTPIACYNECNGNINLQISGGVQPYTYAWEHGNPNNPLLLENLCSGKYALKVTDNINCFVTDTFELINPLPVVVELPDTITLCKGQIYTADAGQYASYEWIKTGTSGIFSTAQSVELSETGTYVLTTTIQNGCKGIDSIYIARDDREIAADFVATTQALKGENIVLINNSHPFAERYEWIFPENNIKVLMQDSLQAEIYFLDSGNYVIYLKAFDGKCNKISEKQITILNETYFPDPGSVEDPFIKEFKVHPNPNTGNFTITVELKDEAPIRLRLIRIGNGAIVNDWQQSGQANYAINCNMILGADAYALILETAKETKVLKIIVQ